MSEKKDVFILFCYEDPKDKTLKCKCFSEMGEDTVVVVPQPPRKESVLDAVRKLLSNIESWLKSRGIDVDIKLPPSVPGEEKMPSPPENFPETIPPAQETSK